MPKVKKVECPTDEKSERTKPMPKSIRLAKNVKCKLAEQKAAALKRLKVKKSSNVDLSLRTKAPANAAEGSKETSKRTSSPTTKAAQIETKPEPSPEVVPEAPSTVRKRSSSGKSNDSGSELFSETRRRHPSAAGKLETSVDAMYRPRKSILEAYEHLSNGSRRSSLSDLEHSRKKTMPKSSSVSTTAKSLVVQNPPVFARKSAPRLIDQEEERAVPNVAKPPVAKPIILEAKPSTPAAKEVASPVISDSTSEDQKKESTKQVAEDTVIRTAINKIRETPDTGRVYNMIDELFDNVMDIYKSEKPDSELICEAILLQLVDLVVPDIEDDQRQVERQPEDLRDELDQEEVQESCDSNLAPVKDLAVEETEVPKPSEVVTESSVEECLEDKPSGDEDQVIAGTQATEEKISVEQMPPVMEEPKLKPNRRRSSRMSVSDMEETEPRPKLRRRNTRSSSVLDSSLIAGKLLDELISEAVAESEAKSSKEEAWEAILATARPVPAEISVPSPEMRFSSEVETDDDLTVFPIAKDLNLRNCLPYQVSLCQP